MNNSIFTDFDLELRAYKAKIKNLMTQPNISGSLRNTCRIILEYPHVINQLVLFERQKRINKILTEIINILGIDMKKGGIILKNNHLALNSIFQRNGIYIAEYELCSFQTVSDIRLYLYNLASIFCTPLEHVYESCNQFQKGEIDLSEYLCLLYEAGLSFNFENFELIFDSPRVFRFSQYVECLLRKDWNLKLLNKNEKLSHFPR